jgi:hypothetical protein
MAPSEQQALKEGRRVAGDEVQVAQKSLREELQ